MQTDAERIVAEFGQRLADLGWVMALHVGGSLATGDHQPGVSDLDLVAVTTDPLTQAQCAALVSIHQAIPSADKLGCTYVPTGLIAAPIHAHTTWTHGQLIDRWLSGLARAELVRHGYAVFGPEPADVWAGVTSNDVRQAAIDELTGYWSWAVRRPWLWSSTDQIDLSATTMLRARHTLATGELITKSAALEGEEAKRLPTHLVEGIRARRRGVDTAADVRLPLDALAAWRLTRRTIAMSRDRAPLTSRE